MSLPLNAATLNWNGSASSDWFNAANWTPAQVPTAADDAVIDANAAVLVGGAVPATFNSLSLGNAAGTTAPVLRVSGTISTAGSLTIQRNAVLRQETAQLSTIGQVTVANGGSITHLANSSARSFLINMSVTGDFDLQAGATITASGLGYAGGSGYTVPGNGPGGGTSNSGVGAGGAHGGAGGKSSSADAGGAAYDNATNPSDLGSGGGGSYPSGIGGAGGGAVLIVVGGTFSLNGQINANGNIGAVSGQNYGSGSGAGGAVNITAAALNGTGQVLANGAAGAAGGNFGGGGAGGRIAMVVTGADTSNLTLQARRGASGGGTATSGGAGVIARKGPGSSLYSLTVGEASVTAQSITPIAGALPVFADVALSNSVVNFDAGSTVTIGGLVIMGTVTVTAARLAPSTLEVTGGAVLQLNAQATSGSLQVDAGGLFRQMNTLPLSFTSVSILTGGAITHAANSTARSSVVNLNVSGDFDLQAGAMIAAGGLGYTGGSGYTVPGNGPGGGTSNSGVGAGGAHGGAGGKSSSADAGGAAYDNATNPTDLGSGGGGSYTNGLGGTGGGAVQLVVGGNLALNGQINANGNNGAVSGQNYGAGGGAGGAVNITAAALNGTGQVLANGAAGASGGNFGGGGAGGRIAVVVTGADTSNLTLQAQRGASGGGTATSGGAGVIARKGPGASLYSLSIGESSVTAQSITPIAGALPVFADVALSNSVVNFDAGSTATIGGLVIIGTVTITAARLMPSTLEVSGGAVLLLNAQSTGGGLQVDAGGIFRQMNTQPLSFTSVSILPGGALTHGANSTARSYLVNLNVSGNFDLQAGAVIAAGALGYAGGVGYQAPGSGPGGGLSSSGVGGGGAHGGAGGKSSANDAGGAAYDSATNPLNLGSGGAGSYTNGIGGAGGGAVLITVGGAFSLNGQINANGGTGTASSQNYGAGGGAGGTVNLTAGSFSGTGAVLANGAAGVTGGNFGGGGGGGIVALTGCNTGLVPSGVNGGAAGGSGATSGGAGSVSRTPLPSCPEPPPSPANLIVASTGSTSSGGATLTLAWNPILAAASYTLQLSGDPAFTIGVTSVTTTASSATISDLVFRTTYYLRVRATNSYGESPYSATLAASVIPSIVDNADSLIVPAGSTYTLGGVHSYSNAIVVDGMLLVAPLNGVTSGFLELSAPAVRINASGVLSADGAGYAARSGPGAGYSTSPGQFDNQGGGGGGGYAGMGGIGGYNGAPVADHAISGTVYGSISLPLELGSGGGNTGGLIGGAGGGRLAITAGTLQIDGRISANGQDGAVQPLSMAAGGGSGGTIVLTATNVHGAGNVSANGGSSLPPGRVGGGGGGGRIVIAYGSSDFTGPVKAQGGSGGQSGGAGTVVYGGELRIENAVRGASTTILSGAYSFDTVRVATHAVVELTSAAAVTAGTLIVEGPNLFNIFTGSLDALHINVRSDARLRYAAGSLTASDLTVSSAAVFTLNKGLSLSQMSVLAGGLVAHEVAQTGFDLSVSGNLTVEAGGRISASGVGFPSLQGPGAGYIINAGQFDDQRGGGGGGYGGLGGAADRFHALSGTAYGSLTQPTDLGSGGGTANGNLGGGGGGKLRIAAGTLQLDGIISADGGNGADSPPISTFKIAGGGGAGGSVWLTVTNLFGSGAITANGGNSFSTNRSGGGGGGGRVAVSYASTAFTGLVTAVGGNGLQRGGAGTIVYGSELRIENSVQGASTPIPSGTYSFDAIKVATGAIVELTPSASLSAPNFTVTGPAIVKLTAGSLTAPRIELFAQSTFRFDAGNLAVTDLFVDSGAVLTVDTRLQAAQLVVRSGGLVNHAGQNAAFELSIANALIVEAGARISADASGFLSAQGPGAGYAVTAGSPFDSGGGGGGGAYGGLGGRSDNFHTFSGAIYGSLVQPLELGSGGGGIGLGGIGGGRLKIGAGLIQLDGRISADGGTSAPGTFTTGGGGSGGAISITAGSIHGAGVVSARGGNSYTPVDRLGGGGGGGRIALFYGSRSGAWSAAAAGGTGKVTGQPGTVLDNGQVSGLDTSASSATIAASQMTPRLESTRDLSETIGAQLLDFSGATSTGTAAGTFSRADVRLVLVKSGSFSEKGFFRGNWAINLSALATLTGEWEGMAYLAPDEPRRLYIKGVLKGQIRGTIDGTLVESVAGSGVFDRLSAACRVVQVDAAVGAGDMFVNGSGVQRENSQYPGTGIKLLQTSLTGLAAGYYSSPLDVTFTFVRVNSQGNPYHGEGFFVASYNSSVGAGSGWAYASSNDQAARLSGFLDSAMRGLMEGALILSDPKSLLLTLQNLDVGLPFLPELLLDFTGPSNGNSGTKVNFSVTVRNNGYSVADGISVVAVYPLGTDFTSASGNYRVYSVVNPAQSFEFPQPFVRWDFPHIAARSSVTMNYQAFVRLPGPGMPASGSKLGGDIQVITTDWADKIFTGYEDRGAP